MSGTGARNSHPALGPVAPPGTPRAPLAPLPETPLPLAPLPLAPLPLAPLPETPRDPLTTPTGTLDPLAPPTGTPRDPVVPPTGTPRDPLATPPDRLVALAELDALLQAHPPLSPDVCARLGALARAIPGRRRRVAEALGREASPAAVDALLTFPPGEAVLGVHRALRAGACREVAGRPCPAQLTLEFRPSRARAFPDLLARAAAAFGPWLERLLVDGQLWYRLALWPAAEPRLHRHLTGHGQDLLWLHGHLARLRGTRLWLNGWLFPAGGAWTPAHQVHLVHGWLDHLLAARQ